MLGTVIEIESTKIKMVVAHSLAEETAWSQPLRNGGRCSVFGSLENRIE